MHSVEVHNLEKMFYGKGVATQVLQGINFTLNPGEWVALMGKSGAGKSTLLNLMGLLDRPTKGSITIGGVDVLSMTDKQQTDFRLEVLGFVFQDSGLVKELNAEENVMVPLLMKGVSFKKARTLAQDTLGRLGLANRLDHRPNELSGGEQQRVSIARAITWEPAILFIDEPTGNLDSESGRQVMELIRTLHVQTKMSIVMVTHDKDHALYCDRIEQIVDGKIVSETIPDHTDIKKKKN